MNPQEENKNPENILKETEVPKKGANEIFSISSLRTYEDDVKNAVQRNNVSTAKILMAEQQKRQKEQDNFEQNSPSSKTNVVKITVSVVFVILGIAAVGGGYYFYLRSVPQKTQPLTVLNSSKIIDTESETQIDAAGKTNREVVGEIRKIIKNGSSEIKENDLKEIKLLRTVITEENGKEFSNILSLETQELFTLLETREPDALVRSLDKEFLLGAHNNKNKIEPFIVFKTNDFEISYAKMLEWEYVLVSNIKDIFFENFGSSQGFIGEEADNTITPEINVSDATTSTSTVVTSTSTTPVINAKKYNEREFKDLVLANRDTRAIIDKDGKTLFFYTFINRDYLILTTNIETLNTIVTRLVSAKLIR